MSIESIIRHDPSQIRVSDKENPEQIINLPLVPVRTVVEGGDGRHWRSFIGIRFDADACVVSDGEQIVDDFEARITRRVVDGGDVAHLGEFGGGVVFEEGEGGDDTRGGDIDGEFVFPDGEPGVTM